MAVLSAELGMRVSAQGLAVCLGRSGLGQGGTGVGAAPRRSGPGPPASSSRPVREEIRERWERRDTVREREEAGVKRVEQVQIWVEKISKIFKVVKWQNSVEHPFHRGILAKPTNSLAFQRIPLLTRAKFPFSRHY
jgi:hypothetical protein